MFRAAGATVSVSACVSLAWVVAESRTCTVKPNEPDALGVPETTPVVAFKVRPAGSVPLLIDQVYGVTPPVLCKVVLYAVPTVALGIVVVVITSTAGATVMLNAWVSVTGVAAESRTCAVKLNEPDALGVPE